MLRTCLKATKKLNFASFSVHMVALKAASFARTTRVFTLSFATTLRIRMTENMDLKPLKRLSKSSITAKSMVKSFMSRKLLRRRAELSRELVKCSSTRTPRRDAICTLRISLLRLLKKSLESASRSMVKSRALRCSATTKVRTFTLSSASRLLIKPPSPNKPFIIRLSETSPYTSTTTRSRSSVKSLLKKPRIRLTSSSTELTTVVLTSSMRSQPDPTLCHFSNTCSSFCLERTWADIRVATSASSVVVVSSILISSA
mmetsp:Transcript_51830/g.71159  ORF Transcript_51830/g.71159 Transcript_51830/m.71159 type:complete len:258 (-) Transcript_51830:502-1275(-)